MMEIRNKLKVASVKMKIERAYMTRGFKTPGYTPDDIKLDCAFVDSDNHCYYATIRVGTYQRIAGVVSHTDRATVTKPDLLSADHKTYDVVDWYNDPRFTLPCTDVKLRVLLQQGDTVDLRGQMIQRTSCKGNVYYQVKRAKISNIVSPAPESEVA